MRVPSDDPTPTHPAKWLLSTKRLAQGRPQLRSCLLHDLASQMPEELRIIANQKQDISVC